MPVLSQSQSPPPHLIIGFVTDTDANPLFEAGIYANTTNQSAFAYSDELGRFTVEVTDYQVNENITVTGLYHGHKASTVVVCDNNPSQMVNLTIGVVSHVIHGYVRRPDGSAAMNFPVNLTNTATGEYQLHLANNSGYYRTDLVGYELGYTEGDGIALVSVFDGFFGTNSSLVSNEPVQAMHLHVNDVQPPEIALRSAPESVSVDVSFIIDVRVTDNYRVESVYIHYADVHGTEHSEEMQVSGGNPPGYNFIIPPQTDTGTVFWHVNATDGFNSTRFPANPAERFNITIFDNTTPTISHTPISTMEAGVPLVLTAIAQDNLQVDTVTLQLWEVGGPTYIPVQMNWNGNPDEYNATIPAQMPGTLRYYITANDTSDNSVRYPVSGNVSVDVVDTTAPTITHTPINSANVNDPINFTAQITDYVRVTAVWINYTDVNDASHNESMTSWGVDMWTHDAPGQNPTGILYYMIWANDFTGNLATAPASDAFAVQINDAGTPIITHTPVASNEVFEPINISVHISDDAGVTEVTLVYNNVTNPSFMMKSMAPINGTNQDDYYVADIPSQGELGFLEYYINATDGPNNITHPALMPSHNVTIEDTTPPVLKLPDDTIMMVPQAFVGQPITPSNYLNHIPNVSDNYQVYNVIMFYRPVGNSTWLQFYMSSTDADARGNGTYTAILPAQTRSGNLTFYFWANDTGGNNATLPEVLPRLNPYSIWVQDGQAPEIEYDPPANISVNSTLTVVVSATDDQGITEVIMHYDGTQDTGYTSVEMTESAADSYIGYVPAQMLSGDLILYFTASDGENTNQSPVFTISVINTPPLITHTNRTNAPINKAIDILVSVEDDVHVVSVGLAWRVRGDTSNTTFTMTSSLFNIYETVLGPFNETQIIEYQIVAVDAETATVWPALDEYAILPVLDTTPPEIDHQPIDPLILNERPIIVANVTDDVGVTSVTVQFTNSSSAGYTTVIMYPVSGNESQYLALLGPQPLGEFSYHIQASDGTNTARFPDSTDIAVQVTAPPSDYWGIILFGVIIVLLVVAIGLVLLHRSKSIKSEDDSSQKGRDDA
jgi:hypothetical protein